MRIIEGGKEESSGYRWADIGNSVRIPVEAVGAMHASARWIVNSDTSSHDKS